MTLTELNQRIERRELKTRSGAIVRKLVPGRLLSGDTIYEVYVEGISWCLVSVYANTGMANDNGTPDEDDLIY